MLNYNNAKLHITDETGELILEGFLNGLLYGLRYEKLLHRLHKKSLE